MLPELVEDFVYGKNVVVTSSAGNGATSLCLYIANILLRDDKIVMLFNPQDSIEKSFVKRFYPRVYDDVVFVSSSVPQFLTFLEYMDYKIDYLIVDPADCMMFSSRLLPTLSELISGKLICSSQIRQDPTKGGQVYSTLENKYMGKIFDYSIWIRNITEEFGEIKRKYIDVFDKKRSGNNQIARYVASFSKEGNILG